MGRFSGTLRLFKKRDTACTWNVKKVNGLYSLAQQIYRKYRIGVQHAIAKLIRYCDLGYHLLPLAVSRILLSLIFISSISVFIVFDKPLREVSMPPSLA